MRCPVLAPFATPLEVLERLNVTSDLPLPMKEELTRALVMEQCEQHAKYTVFWRERIGRPTVLALVAGDESGDLFGHWILFIRIVEGRKQDPTQSGCDRRHWLPRSRA